MRTLRSPGELKDRFEAEAVPLRPRLYVAAVRMTGNVSGSYQEIAGIVGVPRGTVMSRIHRGHKALKVRLLPVRAQRRPSAVPMEAVMGN
ncbi:sigma factor-like helix-turn-helix DNA-binding protein [Kribbella sp. NPDC050241]|uniref:sigma factor-like helix-turn-helix DNA-binding protein n=1 Tax=Kribbella sp. NPDC050241 TaxID=3364115 RepID=UPI0037969A57